MTIQPQDGGAMDFVAESLAVKAQEELRWLGGFLIPSLFDGEHYFISSMIDYFRSLAEQSGIPYQSLINLYLRECVAEQKALHLEWAT